MYVVQGEERPSAAFLVIFLWCVEGVLCVEVGVVGLFSGSRVW